MQHVKKSLFFSFAESYLTTAIQFVASMILARLLTPEEIGQFGTGIAILAIAHMLRDFGVGNYLIRETQLTKQKIRTAFGIALTISWSLGAILFFSRHSIAALYDSSNIEIIIAWMSINFIIIPFSSPALSLLKREMKFDTLLYINIPSTFISAVIAVLLAKAGYSFMSLVWSAIANIAITAILASFFRPKDSFVLPSLKNAREIISFGGKSSMINIVYAIGINSIELIIAKYQGFSAVAIYSKAQTTSNIFAMSMLSAINNVYFPTIAKLNRDNTALSSPFINASSLITILALPFFGFLAIYADPIILLLFGDQWMAAAPLIQILAIAGAITSTFSLSSQTLIAINRPGITLRAETTVQLVRISTSVLAAFHSLALVAWAQVLTSIVTWVIFIWLNKKIFHLSVWSYFKQTVLHSLVIAALSLGMSYYLNLYFINLYSGLILTILVPAILTGLIWLILIVLLKHPISLQLKLRREGPSE